MSGGGEAGSDGGTFSSSNGARQGVDGAGKQAAASG